MVMRPQPPGPVTPWPLPPEACRVLLFGGVFDPPHEAHVVLANAARHALGPDWWLLYVPAARSPFKAGAGHAAPAHRLEMLRLATRHLARCAIWTDELDRAPAPGASGAPSFWVETLERARTVAPREAELRFLIGADQAVEFQRWHRYRDILALGAPVVLLRAPIDTPERLAAGLRVTGAWSEDDIAAWVGRVVGGPLSPASSTRTRGGLAGGDLAASRALDPAVAAHILRHGLYRGGP